MAELTVDFEHLDRERLLADWRWLTGTSKLPVLLAAIGDAFLQDHDGSVHFLDTSAGELERAAGDAVSFGTMLRDPAFVTEHFAVDVVAELRANGLLLEPGQIYSFEQPPVLGGSFETANVEAADIEVHFSITGQIHEQVRDLPAGTPVDQIRLR